MEIKIIYKITYPNNKIYIGKDLTNTLTYFGSVDSKYVEKDFSEKEMQNFIIKKEIIFKSESTEEINKKEMELIRKYESNNPKIGYNKTPKYNENK